MVYESFGNLLKVVTAVYLIMFAVDYSMVLVCRGGHKQTKEHSIKGVPSELEEGLAFKGKEATMEEVKKSSGVMSRASFVIE